MINEEIRKAVENAFRETSRLIVAAEPVYAHAKEFVQRFGTDKMEALRKKLDAETFKTVEEAAAMKAAQLNTTTPRVNVEMVFDRDNANELFLPVRYVRATSLEEDLFKHTADALHGSCRGVKLGRFGDYVAIKVGAVDNKSKMEQSLLTMPEQMQMAGVNLDLLDMVVPIQGSYDSPETARLRLGVKRSSIDYNLIYVNRKFTSTFFPGQLREFEVTTPLLGDARVRIVSESGNYIKGSPGDLRFNGILRGMKLQVGDEVEFERLGDRKYSMKRVARR